MFPYFEILGKTIGSYGFCAMVGLLVCGTLGCLLARRFKIAYEDIILIMVVIGVSLVIGGHLLYGITNADKLFVLIKRASEFNIKQIFGYLVQIFGGMVYYGGFLGACGGLLIYTKFSKTVKREQAFDLFAVCIPLFHVFGRIGCFFSGCCYGVESKFGFVVHGNTLIPELNDVRRLPVSLIEATCNLLIFLVLLRMFLKGKETGKVIFYYMLIYPVARFTLEFFRGDAIRGFLFGLSTSQWISIVLFAVAVWKLFLSKGRKNKAVCVGLLLTALFVTGMTPQTVYATETVANEALSKENKSESSEEMQAIPTTGESSADEPAFTAKEIFVVFVCCIFSLGICIVIAIYGNPNDRLKDKYRRARKQELLKEKRKKEAEMRAIKRAEADAKYEKELAEYEVYMKEYEEAKAAKAAAKEAKKAAKRK